MTRIRNIKPIQPIQPSNEVVNKESDGNICYEGYEHDIEGCISWSEGWNDADKKHICHNCHIYFGHDAKRQLQLHKHSTGLDTGCCYGKCIYYYIYGVFI